MRPVAPWYTHDIAQANVKRRKLERLWRKTKLTVHSEVNVEQCINSFVQFHNGSLCRHNQRKLRQPAFACFFFNRENVEC